MKVNRIWLGLGNITCSIVSLSLAVAAATAASGHSVVSLLVASLSLSASGYTLPTSWIDVLV